LGGSEFYQMMNKAGLHVPEVKIDEVLERYKRFNEAVGKELMASAHAVSRGGLAVHLALIAMAGELGMEIDLSKVPTDKELLNFNILYSESAGRFIVTIAPDNRDEFEKIFEGTQFDLIGHVTETPVLKIRERTGDLIIEEEITLLKDCWKKPFGGLI
ncbi:AIR synthase-related protein, partial [Thermodesulfobacteriota bacterium]